MKVLFVGDAVVDTGFARCTHAVADRLRELGHQVAVLGINYWGGPHTYPYPIFPCYDPTDGGLDQFGATRLPKLANRLKPDLVVLLNDPWNVDEYVGRLRAEVKPADMPKLVGWLAVDSMNQKGSKVNGLDLVVTWCEFGRAELKMGGCEKPIEVCGLGVDPDTYHEMELSREDLLAILPESIVDQKLSDSPPTIVGVVGRNQPRKRLDLAIEAFAQYHYYNSNSYLYLHVAPTGEVSTDLPSVVRHYQVAGRVIVSQYESIGRGTSEHRMAQLCNMFDAYLCTSYAEGWGLPAHEALACGTPIVVPDFAAFDQGSGWLPDACSPLVCRVPATVNIQSAPMNGAMHTIGSTGTAANFCRGLLEATGYRREGAINAARAARALSWQSSAERFVGLLEALHSAPAPATSAE